jgi:hypothetical protein
VRSAGVAGLGNNIKDKREQNGKIFEGMENNDF